MTLHDILVTAHSELTSTTTWCTATAGLECITFQTQRKLNHSGERILVAGWSEVLSGTHSVRRLVRGALGNALCSLVGPA